MKYKLLLLGKNNLWIDEFSDCLWKEYECITASFRSEDIENHYKYFEPDAVVYGMDRESTRSIMSVVHAHNNLAKEAIPLVLIGNKTDFNDFRMYAPNCDVPLMLTKPVVPSAAIMQINDLLNETRGARDELKILKQLEKERREKQAETKMAEWQQNSAEPEMTGVEQNSAEPEMAVEQKRAEPEMTGVEQKQKMIWPPVGSDFYRKHILVVDDSPLMLRTIKEQLHEQYNVATAISGKMALQFLEKHSTNLILLDYEMPEEKGPDVLEKLRANERTKHIPVIFLTGVTDKEKIQKALVNKPQGYLLKPIDREKLMEAIGKILG